jgi:hypothetical protein
MGDRPGNVYLRLTREFNAGRLRCIISSGQAAVLHHVAIMSKDGDWIIREEAASLHHVLGVLQRHGAKYRYGAPLDARWMAGGWSSHFEFQEEEVRVRADFFSRPPRIPQARLEVIWREQERRDPPFVGAAELADLKKTNREKDYAVIGELARLMVDPAERLLYSRSARDLAALVAQHPGLAESLAGRRPLLRVAAERDEGRLEEALDAERRKLIHANEERLLRYLRAAERWADAWPGIAREVEGLPLAQAHSALLRQAESLLPFQVEGGLP